MQPSIWLLALVVEHLPVSTAYAVWSGLGTAAVAVIGALWLGESWDPVKVGCAFGDDRRSVSSCSTFRARTDSRGSYDALLVKVLKLAWDSP